MFDKNISSNYIQPYKLVVVTIKTYLNWITNAYYKLILLPSGIVKVLLISRYIYNIYIYIFLYSY